MAGPYLKAFCRFNHRKSYRMYYVRTNFFGEEIYRCPKCGMERRYVWIRGRVRRVR